MKLNRRRGMAQSDINHLKTMIEINREGNHFFETEQKLKRDQQAEREWVKKLARKIGFGKNFIK